MPKKSPTKSETKSSGCFAAIGKITVSAIGIVFACALAVIFLPKSQTPVQPTDVGERALSISASTPVPTDPPTVTDSSIQAPLAQKAEGFDAAPPPTTQAIAMNSLLPPPTKTVAAIPPTDTLFPPTPTATALPQRTHRRQRIHLCQ